MLYLSRSKKGIEEKLKRRTEMVSAKNVILTAIKFKGTEQVKKESKSLADNLLCSQAYVMKIVKSVEAGKIEIA